MHLTIVYQQLVRSLGIYKGWLHNHSTFNLNPEPLKSWLRSVYSIDPFMISLCKKNFNFSMRIDNWS